MYGYIYITTDLKTNKKYIGKHKSAVFEFDKYHGSGIDINSIPKEEHATRLHTQLLPPLNGVNTICESLEELNSAEQYYLDYYDCVKSEEYYNRSSGGDGGDIYSLLTDEQKKTRDEQISRKSKQWWDHADIETIKNRSASWKKTYFNKTSEQKAALTLKNSLSQKRYNSQLTEEQRIARKNTMQIAAQKRVQDSAKEAKRKEKEKITKSKHTAEQKAAYKQKQQEQQIGRHYYTDGTRTIKCKPEDAPYGFVQCKGHSNTSRYICMFDAIEYVGLNNLLMYLISQGYQNITTEKLLLIAKNKEKYRKKFPNIVDRLKIYDRKQGVTYE